MSLAVAYSLLLFLPCLLFSTLVFSQEDSSDMEAGECRVNSHCPFGGSSLRFHITSQRDERGQDVFKAHVDKTLESVSPWNVTVHLDNKCGSSEKPFQRMTLTFVGNSVSPPAPTRHPTTKSSTSRPTPPIIRSSTERGIVVAPLTDRCLECICAGRGCGRNNPYLIQMGYWVEGGRIGSLPFDRSDTDGYNRCISDYACSEQTVISYMSKYHRDCNGDGHVNCFDYFAMHMLGHVGCTTGWPRVYHIQFSREPACSPFL